MVLAPVTLAITMLMTNSVTRINRFLSFFLMLSELLFLRLIDFSSYIALSIPELRIIKPKTFREDTRYLAGYIKDVAVLPVLRADHVILWQMEISANLLIDDKFVAGVQPVSGSCRCQGGMEILLLGVEDAWYFRERMRRRLKNPQINVFHFEDGRRGLDRRPCGPEQPEPLPAAAQRYPV